jgi:cellulose synthase/poly-beta-1,6-N-acetylglucosamine synthase-like glycosyltransferase
LQAALALDYLPSKFCVHVCDDGARDPTFTFKPRIAALQAALPPGSPALQYSTRPNGHHAKAGNLNNALKQARGQVVVVLDADMVAVPGFLQVLIPHLLAEEGAGAKEAQEVPAEQGGANTFRLVDVESVIGAKAAVTTAPPQREAGMIGTVIKARPLAWSLKVRGGR